MLGIENDFGGKKHNYPQVKQEVISKLLPLTLTQGSIVVALQQLRSCAVSEHEQDLCLLVETGEIIYQTGLSSYCFCNKVRHFTTQPQPQPVSDSNKCLISRKMLKCSVEQRESDTFYVTVMGPVIIIEYRANLQRVKHGLLDNTSHVKKLK